MICRKVSKQENTALKKIKNKKTGYISYSSLEAASVWVHATE